MHDQLRAGAAVYNDGHYHAAHDAWEEHWLDLESGTDDEQLLHGLIQLSGAVFHAHRGNWQGTVGLADSARGYLDGLPATYRGVALASLRDYLASLSADPELIERRSPVRIEHDGVTPTLDSLDVAETGIAAVTLAQEFGYDEGPIERARTYARRDLEDGDDDSRFISLLFDFVREEKHRGIVYQRLSEHAGKRQAREEDVEGLFSDLE
ncbi:DUF309 domain-containing protein [Halobiforma nitratireducens]|uniref:DUF309 domain-containing protein n=1 Tax=Halobiforma nitratireducens JCM 10879 TaxID=1227454 RepID=M0LAH0_9EURY|nr:DUF309 domain-containing protein [Halobiforma nitratireducens]EMA30571.1 hypothetical protein C446_16435 [Halobiforma nitratireducens JCM 10879]